MSEHNLSSDKITSDPETEEVYSHRLSDDESGVFKSEKQKIHYPKGYLSRIP